LNQSGLGASVNVNATVNPITADVTVGEKITGTAKESYLFKFFKLSGTSKYLDNVGGGGNVCSAAAYDAVNSSGADVIVNPQYVRTMSSNLFTSSEECTVTGYKGTLSTFE
tara:strand:- start:227 stop:559 length:333 start_codon:yes stop_codon:yes gene_type:complete